MKKNVQSSETTRHSFLPEFVALGTSLVDNMPQFFDPTDGFAFDGEPIGKGIKRTKDLLDMSGPKDLKKHLSLGVCILVDETPAFAIAGKKSVLAKMFLAGIVHMIGGISSPKQLDEKLDAITALYGEDFKSLAEEQRKDLQLTIRRAKEETGWRGYRQRLGRKRSAAQKSRKTAQKPAPKAGLAEAIVSTQSEPRAAEMAQTKDVTNVSESAEVHSSQNGTGE